MDATVVVPTRDRHETLALLVQALRRQETERSWEVIVCDDASEPPVDPQLDAGVETTVIRCHGEGQATARNAGWRAARGEIVIFADDDTQPVPGWVDAAVSWLEQHPEDVAVEGRIVSRPWDELRELSVENHGPGGYLTANFAFRRATLEQLGGFVEAFRHCEDYDLAYRAEQLGTIGYCDAMEVSHQVRPMSIRQVARRGRLAGSEMLLFRRHRRRFGHAWWLPAPVFAIVNQFYAWALIARRDAHRWVRAPGRPLLLLTLFAGSLVNAVVAIAQAYAPGGRR